MLKVLKCFRTIIPVRNFAKKSNCLEAYTIQKDMKYLNVAEKHDAAKTVSALLSNGTASRREGYSVYNKIFDFEANVRGTKCKMVMTSVSGHLLTHEFLSSYRNWHNVDPSSLFDAPVRKACPEDYQPIKRTLEREIRSCGGLIIWTDCDREGENIGFEIIDVCRAVKPNINVYRAVFSEITGAAVRRALLQLKQPDKRQSDAVDIRSELDLRTGAAITRFQTMRLQRLFPQNIANKLISYGSCQIPTLGFVAERYKEIEAFVSEPFWKIKVIHTIDDLTVEFNWARNRLFDKQACEDFYVLCLADPHAKVESITVKPKSKWRPTPLDTVELEKLGSRKLKLSAKEVMTIAEKLYTKGIISYPRTETNQFSNEIDLRSIVEQQTGHNDWGSFAERVVNWGPNPRNGNKSDQAHPPIHPTKLVTNLQGNEALVYELICRHFLACVSKDATGSETIVKIDIAGEKFSATGLVIYERNYLDVYIYEKWNAKQIHNYTEGQIFDPTEISMPEGATTPPALLTEADLIALMEKHGIGTDATHAEHINTIKERGYIGVVDKGFLVPGLIGMGLYEGYDAMQLALAKPVLRAEFEADLKKICLGEKDPKVVLREQIIKYKEAYKQIIEKVTAMDEKVGIRINETPTVNNSHEAGNYSNNPNRLQEIFKCPRCDIASMALKTKKNQNGYFIGCLNFPDCKNVIWLPEECQEPNVLDESCPNCNENRKLLKFKFSTVYYKTLFDTPGGRYKTCLACDSKFRENFNINLENIKRVGAIVGVSNANINATSSGSNSLSANTITSRIGGGVNTGNSTFTGNGGSDTGNRSNSSKAPGQGKKKKPTGTENKTTQNKRSQKTTTTHLTNIRNFFTPSGTVSAASTTQQISSSATATTESTSTEFNGIDDIFDSNSSFNDIISNAEENNAENNGARNKSENILSNDIVAAFQNDDDDDWAMATVNPPITAPNAIASTSRSLQNNSNFHGNSNDNSCLISEYNDSFSDIYRTEIDYDSMAWGTACRNNRLSQDPVNKRPRLETTEVLSTSGMNWGSRAPVFSRNSAADESPTTDFDWGSAGTAAITPTSHEVKCSGCHQEAKKLSVKKDGNNKGRIFYVCPKDKQCKFFQWDDELPSTSLAVRSDNSSNQNTENNSRTNVPSLNSHTFQSSSESYSWGSGSQANNTSSAPTNRVSWSKLNAPTRTEDGNEVKCSCGKAASSLRVRKEGTNKGRPFFSCAQRSCNFFQWADENENQASSGSNANIAWGTGKNNQFSGSNSTAKSKTPNNEREVKKRKCGLCRQEGHTKLKCPRKAEYDFFT